MEKVRSGEAVNIKAATWNSFVDAANWVKEAKQNSVARGVSAGLDVGIVRIKNSESTLYPRFSALVITGVCVSAETNEEEFTSCPPVFEGLKMTADREGKPYAILLEPIEAGEIGRAMILGVTPAKVTINSSDDGYAVPKAGSSEGALESSATGTARILWRAGGGGEQWCVLQLGGAGAGQGEDKALMCKVGGGTATAGYTVTVYPNGRSDEGGVEYSALLFLPDVALDADIPAGTWIIGHKSAMASTGGSET